MAHRAIVRMNLGVVRIDGSVALPGRDKALEALRHDEGVKVILMTISSGGVG